jgi:hypothetical protein
MNFPSRQARNRAHNQLPILGDKRHSLRLLERYAQGVLHEQPYPPRRIAYWYLTRHLLTYETVAVTIFLIICILVLLVLNGGIAGVTQHAQLLRGMLLGCIGITWLWVDKYMLPWMRWYRGLKYGRHVLGRVQSATLRPYRGDDVLHVEVQFEVAEKTFVQSVKLSMPHVGHWIYAVQEGTVLHLLLHGSRPKIFVVLGPVAT